MKSLLLLILVGLFITTAWSIGEMRHQMGYASSQFASSMGQRQDVADNGALAFVLLTIIIPLCVAYLWHEMSDFREAQQKAVQKQRLWEARQEEMLRLRQQREEVIRMTSERRALVERKRKETQEKIRALEQRPQAVEQEARETIEIERRQSIAYATGHLSALEQDRYYFIKAAKKAKKDYLIYENPVVEYYPGHANSQQRLPSRPF